jgi:hypothetical protein
MQIHQENQADLGTLSVNMKRSPLWGWIWFWKLEQWYTLNLAKNRLPSWVKSVCLCSFFTMGLELLSAYHTTFFFSLFLLLGLKTMGYLIKNNYPTYQLSLSKSLDSKS